MMRHPARPAEPQPAPALLDRAHLWRQTEGDLPLQRELLEIFRPRAAEIVDRLCALAAMQPLQDTPLCDLAHQLRGSALAIGAFGVAAEAEAVECAFRLGEAAQRQKRGAAALKALIACLAQTSAAIDAHMSAVARAP
jgi:HPt (histidine-containing phosphotransfer) domain-containing protein